MRRPVRARYCKVCLRDECIPECNGSDFTNGEINALSLLRMIDNPEAGGGFLSVLWHCEVPGYTLLPEHRLRRTQGLRGAWWHGP